MRSMIRAAAVAVAVGVGAAGVARAQQSTPKFAYLNSQLIMQQAPGGTEAAATLQRELASYQAQIQRMGDSLQAMVNEYNKAELTLSPAAKESRQKAIRTKEDEFERRRQQLEQQAQGRQAELMRPIQQLVSKTIDDIRAEEGYTMIFDIAAAPGVVVSADRNLDITDRVIARVQAAKPTAQRPDTTKPAGAPVASPAAVTRPKNPPAQ